MSYQIIPSYGHYKVYINNRFYCSADTLREATKEVEDYMRNNTDD